MKAAVITRHAVSNYGSFLQAWATQKVIEKLGHNCVIIDYIRDDEYYKHIEKTLLKHKPEWYNNPVKRLFYLLLRQPTSLIAGRMFEKERKSHLNLTKRYSSLKELTDNQPQSDVYITGSDQVWGPVADGTLDPAYCLAFTNDNDKKIAYAGSFGNSNIGENQKAYYKKWLSKYTALTVREKSAAKALKALGLDARAVLDPTLLLDSSVWKEQLQPINKKRYVLVYQIHNDKKVGEYAKKVAKAKGLPLVRISASFHQILREGRFVFAPKIKEFLSYINNAECLITDSFHGTAFSINLNTPFVEVLPNNKTSERNSDILKLLGLSDRILNDETNVELADKEIDFSRVNDILNKKRNESLTILKKMIEN